MESVVKVAKKRNSMISIAKAIGIILMVIGHVYDKESWGGTLYIYVSYAFVLCPFWLFFQISPFIQRVSYLSKEKTDRFICTLSTLVNILYFDT